MYVYDLDPEDYIAKIDRYIEEYKFKTICSKFLDSETIYKVSAINLYSHECGKGGHRIYNTLLEKYGEIVIISTRYLSWGADRIDYDNQCAPPSENTYLITKDLDAIKIFEAIQNLLKTQ